VLPLVTLSRRVTAEGLGSMLLLAAVVGSGIMGERLAGGNSALALLANAIATGTALIALIFAFAPVSGAHFNPLVTATEAFEGRVAWREVPVYIAAQICGAFLGVALAHAMFGMDVLQASRHVRQAPGEILGELVATFGLLATIAGCSSRRPEALPYAVAAYITGAYWFTSSTSFANPAVTLARAATDTFSGIRPSDVPFFVGAQIVGATASLLLFRWLLPRRETA
jgi:glycerol uptake facilitator-like aquaporin